MKRILPISLAATMLVALLLATVSSAYATPGNATNQPLAGIRIINTATNPLILLQFNVVVSSLACSPAPANQSMAIDASTPKGKLIASSAMAALLAGKKINLIGTGNCTGTGVYEGIDSFSVGP
jgi:hypothetical protein